MFDRFRHQPLAQGVAESVPRSGTTGASHWLRRPVLGRHADRDVATHLDRELHGLGAVLHGVQLPHTTHSVDHLVIAPSGIWLIETAHLAGRLTHRVAGSRHEPESMMLLDGIDRTPLVDSLGVLSAARESVAAMQFGVDVQTATCLIDTTWPISAHPFKVGDHWVTWPRALTDKIQSSGLLPIRVAHDIARAISERQDDAASVTLSSVSARLAS